MKNYYEILEVSSKASQEVIEKSYKVLAKKYHPDVQTGTNRYLAEETLKDINEAYSVLSDIHLRQAYDREYSKMYGNKNEDNNYSMYNYNKYNNIEENEEPHYQPKREKVNRNKTKANNSGTGIIGLIGNIINSFKNLKNKDYREKQANDLSQKFIALGLTILIMGAIILILWNIPFTRNWIMGV